MTPHDLRHSLHREAVAKLFGPDWRGDRPLENLGGLVGQMVSASWLHQADALARVAKLAGEADATLRAVGMVDDAARAEEKALNQPA